MPARMDGTPSFVCKNAVTKPAHAPASIAANMPRMGCPAAVTVTDTAAPRTKQPSVTCGVNYTDLGAKTADLAYKAITEGMDGMEDYYLMDGGIITVNTETAEGLGADCSVFKTMANTVTEVTTVE